MDQLLTREQHKDAIQELRAQFQWIGASAVLDHTPGHHRILSGFLEHMEAIVGAVALKKNLKFLRVTDTEDSGLRIYWEVLRLHESRFKAVVDAAASSMKSAQRSCAACGFPANYSRYCESHQEVRSPFLEDILAAQEASEQAQGQETDLKIADLFNVDGDVPAGDAVVVEGQPEESAVSNGPVVTVFTEADVLTLEQSAKGKDGDAKARITEVVRKLREAGGGQKPLATLCDDWKVMLERLADHHPNFGEFIDFLRDQCSLSAMGDMRVAFPPVLFDGPPGIGKTEMALSLAELIDTPLLSLDMASAQCGSSLSGSDSFWSNSQPGRLFEMLAYGRKASPIVFMDEIDKITGDSRYRPDAALYQLLEARTAAQFTDLSVPDLKVDASNVIWLAASNEIDRVSQPIRSRFVVFDIPAPSRTQCVSIAHSIYKRLVGASHWGPSMAPGITHAVAEYLADLPPRTVRTQLFQACGRAARDGRKDVRVADIAWAPPAKRPGIGFLSDFN